MLPSALNACPRQLHVDASGHCCDFIAVPAENVQLNERVPKGMQFDRQRLELLCRERGISRLDLFGSALREDFRADSDVDLLATLCPEAQVTLLDWADIQEQL